LERTLYTDSGNMWFSSVHRGEFRVNTLK